MSPTNSAFNSLGNSRANSKVSQRSSSAESGQFLRNPRNFTRNSIYGARSSSATGAMRQSQLPVFNGRANPRVSQPRTALGGPARHRIGSEDRDGERSSLTAAENSFMPSNLDMERSVFQGAGFSEPEVSEIRRELEAAIADADATRVNNRAELVRKQAEIKNLQQSEGRGGGTAPPESRERT